MSQLTAQSGLLATPVKHARYLSFRVHNSQLAWQTLSDACRQIDGHNSVLGLGAGLIAILELQVPSAKDYPVYPQSKMPQGAAQDDLWLWLRGDEIGKLWHLGQQLIHRLAPAFTLNSDLDGFLHDGGKDLTGYEDGTENPQQQAAVDAAIAEDGSSYVVVQRWAHQWSNFHAMSQPERDHCIGRQAHDNEEIDDAPAHAHVKRTAQEQFEPEAFLLRRSLAWRQGEQSGLQFVAFGRDFRAFEVQWQNMLGINDGIVDGLFRFSQPTQGAYYWCPPMSNGQPNLVAYRNIAH